MSQLSLVKASVCVLDASLPPNGLDSALRFLNGLSLAYLGNNVGGIASVLRNQHATLCKQYLKSTESSTAMLPLQLV